MPSFIKIRPVGAELFHADRQTDEQDERNSHFRNFVKAPKKLQHVCKSILMFEINFTVIEMQLIEPTQQNLIKNANVHTLTNVKY